MKKYVKWAAAIAVVGALAGCSSTVPIAIIHSTITTSPTEAQVRSAIMNAGVERRWMMKEEGKGVIVARQQVRNHNAEVRINYNESTYSITYSNSTNLEAANGQIHRNYNRWVRNLDKSIKAHLYATAGR